MPRAMLGLIAIQGLAAYFIFPSLIFPAGHPALAWLAIFLLAPFFWITLRHRGWSVICLGGFSGVAMFLLPVGYTTQMSYFPVIGWLIWLFIGVIIFISAGAEAWLISEVAHRRLGWFPVAAPALFATYEFIRLAGAPGFWLIPPPLAMTAYPLATYPVLIQMASVAGVIGVEFSVHFIAAVSAWGVYTLGWFRRGKPASAPWPAWTLAGILLVSLGIAGLFWGGLQDAARSRREEAKATHFLHTGLLQPNFDAAALSNREESAKRQTLRLYREMIISPEAREAKIVVFPEDALPGSLPGDQHMWDGLRDIFKEADKSAVVGLITEVNESTSYNIYYWVNPQGQVENHYIKQFLMPFGEYMPMRRMIAWVEGLWQAITHRSLSIMKLTALDADFRDLTPGRTDRVFQQEGKAFFIKICDELLFPQYFRNGVLLGGGAVLSPATGNWFQSPEYLHHYRMAAQFRAVETRRWIGRTVNLASAFYIDAQGRVRKMTPFQTRAVAVAAMPLLGHVTPYVRYGDWLGWGLMGVSFLVLVVLFVTAWFPQWRRRRKEDLPS